jgi:hypothetical protein
VPTVGRAPCAPCAPCALSDIAQSAMISDAAIGAECLLVIQPRDNCIAYPWLSG